MERKEYERAESALVKSIGLADHDGDYYLLYGCFTQLAFLQNLKGNTPGAVTSFRQARKVASQLNDAYLQILIDINISDIYQRNKLYSQSLVYLDQAQSLMRRQQLNGPQFHMMILVNKAENYFSMGRTDSLAKYAGLLLRLQSAAPRLYTFQQRSLYSLELLHRQYGLALRRLESLKKDSSYFFDATDDQNLARALYETGRLDSASAIALRLLEDAPQRNHPEVTLPLYEMLGRIPLAESNNDLAVRRFDEALQQAKLQITSLVEVDTISARLKLDEMQGRYLRREEGRCCTGISGRKDILCNCCMRPGARNCPSSTRMRSGDTYPISWASSILSGTARTSTRVTWRPRLICSARPGIWTTASAISPISLTVRLIIEQKGRGCFRMFFR
jgi:tetratricopeptide (TPR) repeat protein